MLAQKIALKTDERAALVVAKNFMHPYTMTIRTTVSRFLCRTDRTRAIEISCSRRRGVEHHH
jgi:hypothetical protein